MQYLEITSHLQQLADEKIAEHSQRFFKTAKGEYGYGDVFLGIRVPVIRQAVRKYRTAPTGTAKRLLKSRYHEVRLFALLLLVYKFSKGDEKEQKEIFDLYLAHTRYINNWDLVDSSAHQIVGGWLEGRKKDILYELAESDSLWERRIAIIATYRFIRNDRFTETLRISRRLLADREDLIHKAVGWMLREVGNRDRNKETVFLKTHYRKMPRTMLRYAIEKYSKAERQKYLKGEV